MNVALLRCTNRHYFTYLLIASLYYWQLVQQLNVYFYFTLSYDQ